MLLQGRSGSVTCALPSPASVAEDSETVTVRRGEAGSLTRALPPSQGWLINAESGQCFTPRPISVIHYSATQQLCFFRQFAAPEWLAKTKCWCWVDSRIMPECASELICQRLAILESDSFDPYK